MTESSAPEVMPRDSIGVLMGDEPDELTPTRFAMERGLLVIGDRTELILVRHAQPLRTNAEANRQGGPSLSEVGHNQARLTGEYLAGETRHLGPIAAVYCSDLNRTMETAHIVAAVLSDRLTPKSDEQLREVDMFSRNRGGADVSAETQAKAGVEFGRTLRWDAFPNTESSDDFRNRIITALERIAQSHPNQRIVVISHAGAICAAVAGLIHARPDMFYYAGHASVNRIFYGDDHFVIHSLNEIGHLRAVGPLTF